MMDENEFKHMQFHNDRLWEYFKYHAQQRLETFRFFFIMAAIFVSGIVSFSFKNPININDTKMTINTFVHSPIVGCVFIMMGIFLGIFSWVFWKLDSRNHLMIVKSREMLIEMENINKKYMIFSKIQYQSDQEKLWRFQIWFKIIFGTFGILGIALFILGIFGIFCRAS